MTDVRIKSLVSGWKKIQAVGPDGKVRDLTDWYPNLITDNGLDLMGDTASWLNVCAVGNGTTAPAVTDTAIESLVASTTTVVTNTAGATSASPYYTWRRKTFEFSVGTAAGNLTEVTIGPSSSNVLSRSLIKDSMGNPTTITVLSDEILRVIYEFRISAPEVDGSGTTNISGTDHDWVTRASDVDNASNWSIGASGVAGDDFSLLLVTDGAIGSITGIPSGSADGPASTTVEPYVAGSYEVQFTSSFGTGDGNFAGGIGAAFMRIGWGQFQIGYTPNIPKDNTLLLSLTFKHSWARA